MGPRQDQLMSRMFSVTAKDLGVDSKDETTLRQSIENGYAKRKILRRTIAFDLDGQGSHGEHE